MENEIRIAADEIALRLLVIQLYTQKFFDEPRARVMLPEAILTATKRDAEEAALKDVITSKVMTQVHLSVERFFVDEEDRLSSVGR